jgi:hypothetical protein
MPTFKNLTIKRERERDTERERFTVDVAYMDEKKNAYKIRVRKPERTRGLCEPYEYMETQFNLTQQRESVWNEIIWLGTLSIGGCRVDTARSFHRISLNGWVAVSTKSERM